MTGAATLRIAVFEAIDGVKVRIVRRSRPFPEALNALF
jgi:hypothetical protein